MGNDELEFKAGLSTHDVITYSAKARKHKQVYPYLRYGLVVDRDTKVPGKFFTHNEALDYCLAAASYVNDPAALRRVLSDLIEAETRASRQLEAAAFGKRGPDIYRTEIRPQHPPDGAVGGRRTRDVSAGEDATLPR